jgi:hypothetical protein
MRITGIFVFIGSTFLSIFALAKDLAQIERQPPSIFKEVPSAVIKQLESKKCIIPQSTLPKPNNLISGEFARKGQKDWAALCNYGTSSKILVVWGGTAKCSDEVGLDQDNLYVHQLGDKKLEYSRGISRIKHAAHDAIDDAFIEKASSVHYCSNGKWESLLGSD